MLIACATSLATPERTARVRAIVDGGIDWQIAIRMASMQAVVPLVYRYLTSELEDALPPAAADGLRRAFYGNSVRNLHLARELLRLTALLGAKKAIAKKAAARAMASARPAIIGQKR